MYHNMAKSAFWQAHEQFPQLPEFEDFYEAVNAVTPPEPVAIEDLQEREKAGTYSGFEIPTEKTLQKIAWSWVPTFVGSVAPLGSRSPR